MLKVKTGVKKRDPNVNTIYTMCLDYVTDKKEMQVDKCLSDVTDKKKRRCDAGKDKICVGVTDPIHEYRIL